MRAGPAAGRSPEITDVRMVALDELDDYDLFSTDARFLRQDLPRLMSAAGLE